MADPDYVRKRKRETSDEARQRALDEMLMRYSGAAVTDEERRRMSGEDQTLNEELMRRSGSAVTEEEFERMRRERR